MLFHSDQYAGFLLATFCANFLAPQRWRWIVLLAASYAFCAAWDPRFALCIGFSTLVSYACGIGIERATGGRAKRRWLLIGIFCTLAPLILFKYANFLLGAFADTAALFGSPAQAPILRLLLPIGISFYTLQIIGYLADVSAGRTAAEKHLGIYALYVCFFPQLAAGPIARSTELLPQLRVGHPFREDQATDGLRLIVWGLFLKTVLADNLAVYVDSVYADTAAFTGPQLFLATQFFSAQILCDFAGYTAAAIGSAMLLGFTLRENFRRPYLATSIRDFWNRWHISLSTWLRDYVYIPLGGSRCSALAQTRNVLVTFAVSGLWHGANWTFLIWGMLHGIGVAIEHLWSRRLHLPALFGARSRWLRILVIFQLVTFAWVFFRADSLRDAWYVLTHMAIQWLPADILAGTGMTPAVLAMSLALLGTTALAAIGMERAGGYVPAIRRLPTWTRWSVYCAETLAILFLQANQSGAFLYAQF